MSHSFTQAWEAFVAHFGAAQINGITSSRRQFGDHLLPDLQAAVIARIAPFEPDLMGVHQLYEQLALTISGLLVRDQQGAIAITPLQYQDIDVGEEEPFAALNNGLWLFKVEGRPVAVLLSHYAVYGEGRFAQIEVATLADPVSLGFVRAFLAAVQEAGATSTRYRGKILSFESGSDYSGMRAVMQVHRLPFVDREAVILDTATMAKIDRHVFAFDHHREALKRLGQSTRKGVLLYGPPGTGKTHVIRYIASNLPDRTTVLVTAEQVKMLSRYMLLARTLQPSIVVLEDVDLVGRSREGMNSPNTEVLLNRLLNEMDGLQDDADVLFILTTNRPEEIEEALASRPGRIDEAIEVANPDASCRARLVALYGRALDFEDGAVADFVARSEGASAAFVKEMVRRVAQVAVSAGRGNRVGREDVAVVLGEATESRNRIGRRIVGLANHSEARAGKQAPPFDACGSDL
ncbi:ATP-binding protein [Methylobacterium pseudosasicola]|uniref:ATPase family associated with various cellular activities (AAA) n=1 Tax=Methylobacterium pseudosasicola TaxID=582667 RepID=A0A1I4GDX4_9HYPH|nr:ATP-binding protein [Methylobacterium pseudosasicola]SFL27361.1 ATPase family associated with various cellular activities (AAA) [Methylobacterium pseudosasicola]